MTKDFMKSTRFYPEIWWISPWNLVDFTCKIWWISPRFHLFTCEIQQSSPRFHLWNPSTQIIKASVLAKTLQFDECKVGAMTKDFMKSAWNLPDFTWNLPDFMKSGGFHVKSKDLLQGIVTLCFQLVSHTKGDSCKGIDLISQSDTIMEFLYLKFIFLLFSSGSRIWLRGGAPNFF